MRYHASTEALIQTAARKARDLGHSYVGSAHLLLALTSEAGGMGLVLRQLGVEPELTEALARRADTQVCPTEPVGDPCRGPMGASAPPENGGAGGG